MKKSLAAIATASLMSLGFVGATAGTAHADCPYSTCVNPTPRANVPDVVQVGQKIKLKFSANVAGNTEAVGRVKFIVRGPGGYRVVKTRAYNGGKVQANSSKTPTEGVYKVTIKFLAKSGSIFNGAKTKGNVIVR